MKPDRKKEGVSPDAGEEKRMQIIDAAQKRFGIYGYEKTAVQEIADDLGISKALVYYYFPDKSVLFHDVIEKEQKDFFNNLEEKICIQCSPVEKLRQYVTFRLDHFLSFVNLTKLRSQEYNQLIRPVVQDLIDKLRAKDHDVVIRILEAGVQQGLFVIPDVEESSLLFLETLRCLRHSVIQNKNLYSISPEEFESAAKRIRQFLELYIRGITNPEQKLNNA